jgi:hypothetical protein
MAQFLHENGVARVGRPRNRDSIASRPRRESEGSWISDQYHDPLDVIRFSPDVLHALMELDAQSRNLVVKAVVVVFRHIILSAKRTGDLGAADAAPSMQWIARCGPIILCFDQVGDSAGLEVVDVVLVH